MRPRLSLIGHRSGRLEVIAFDGKDRSQNTKWMCRCDCGGAASVRGTDLKAGRTQSCGCFVAEAVSRASKKHGHHNDRLHRIWVGMISRTTRPNHPSFRNYGARGISVCSEWADDFFKFKAWAISAGYRDDLSIDRVNNGGNYTPNNCRWATPLEQAANRRKRSCYKLPEKGPEIMDFKAVAAQGEIYITRVDAIPDGLSALTPEHGRFVISHSEQGHHHVLDASNVEVLERTKDVPTGLAILYAIVKEPTSLRQTAHAPHGAVRLDPGIYRMTISREFNPFAEEARRVAD